MNKKKNHCYNFGINRFPLPIQLPIESEYQNKDKNKKKQTKRHFIIDSKKFTWKQDIKKLVFLLLGTGLDL